MPHDDDLAAQFARDQDHAKAQEEDRDKTTWDLNVRHGEADVDVKERHAMWDTAKAATWFAVAALVRTTTGLLVIAFLTAWVLVVLAAIQG